MAITKIIEKIEQSSEYAGAVASWLTTTLVLVIMIDVVMRYLFNISFVWVTELEWHIFALIFLLGAGYTLKHDAHVRVDLFYAGLTEKRKALVNMIGVAFFLLPWCVIVTRASFKYAANSFRIGETSPDAGGLPALWLIKGVIVVAFLLLSLQALALFLRGVQVLRGNRETVFPNSA